MVSGQYSSPADAPPTDNLDADEGTLVARMVSVALRETPVNEATSGLANRPGNRVLPQLSGRCNYALRPRSQTACQLARVGWSSVRLESSSHWNRPTLAGIPTISRPRAPGESAARMKVEANSDRRLSPHDDDREPSRVDYLIHGRAGFLKSVVSLGFSGPQAPRSVTCFHNV